MDNMKIWDQVCTTDPSQTKESGFGRKFTSISPQYQLQEATKVFGPYGKGFGFESCDIELFNDLDARLCFVKAVFFFVDEDGRHTFPINNTWSIMAGSAKKGTLHVDEDFAKKAETNTMSKALSRLGFGADVFLGKFDDHEYVQVASNTAALANAEDKIEEAAKQEREHQAWVDNTIKTISTSVNLHELQTLFTSVVRKAKLTNDMVSVGKFDNAKNKRKAELEKQEQL